MAFRKMSGIVSGDIIIRTSIIGDISVGAIRKKSSRISGKTILKAGLKFHYIVGLMRLSH